MVFSAGSVLYGQSAPVSAVTGESWLVHLNRSFGDTSMGKTGHLGPATFESAEDLRRLQVRLLDSNKPQTVTLHGSDLYRINCQGCHGPSGLGAPPEIHSMVNPVRSTSVALIIDRMKSAGADISRSDATQMAQQSRAALFERLHHGGEAMPPFLHLQEAEVRSLIAYLKLLAGVPGSETEQLAIKESPVRVGEHIVKSTCNICHGATGASPGPQQLLDGAIPPLETLPSRVTQAEFVRKVTQGAPIMMGTPPLLCRGRMPVFYYLSEEEAADAYLYLTLYPPSERATTASVMATSGNSQGTSGDSGRPGPPTAPSAPEALVKPAAQPEKSAGMTTLILLAVWSFVVVLVAAGLSFTMREFKRLSRESEQRQKSGGIRISALQRMEGSLTSSAPTLMRRIRTDSVKVT
jgi:mono/diheme cytochrome c family protein